MEKHVKDQKDVTHAKRHTLEICNDKNRILYEWECLPRIKKENMS